MDVAITGSTGLIGSALVERLQRDGNRVVRVVRPSTAGAEGDTLRWDPTAGTIDAAGIEGLDAVVNLAGRPIGAKRLTEAEKRRIRDSRVRGTRLLAEALAGLQRPPSVLLNASAIGLYGSRGEEVITEASGRGGGFMADVVADWEAATSPATDAGIRTVLIRTGLLLQAGTQILGRMVPIFRLGLGGRLGSGEQWWSWISLPDEVGAIVHLLEGDASGPVNLTAPKPVTNAEFARVLGRVLRRPAVVPVPRLALQAVLGKELADEVAFAGVRALPQRLQATGYEFTHPELEGALRSLLDRPVA